MAKTGYDGFDAATAVAEQAQFVGQVEHHAQLFVANVQLDQRRFLVVPFLALGHQVVDIQVCLADTLSQGVFVTVRKMRQIHFQLHRKKNQLAMQTCLSMNGLRFVCHGNF